MRAVDDVSFDVDDGEFFALLGPSGSGKTTCLRLIAGFEQPNAGHIEIHGRTAEDVPLFRRNVNTVFQDYALFPHLSVLDNVAYGPRVRGVGRAERYRLVEEMLALVKLEGFGERKPAQLSGGQRQRVALARALINRPRVLLLDEPLGALDLKLRQQMQVELKALQRQVGITFIFVTHDQDEALSMSDRLAVFNQGRIEQIGRPEQVYEHPATPFVAGFVGTSNILDEAAARRVSGEPKPFAVRPEKILLLAADESPDGDGDWVVAAGEVLDVQYHGANTRYQVRLDCGVELLVSRQNWRTVTHAPSVRPGERVRTGWRRDDAQPIASGDLAS